ncbi:trypsin-like serine protease [Actinoplanes sp. TRM 88003]|uniref:Trypsin-like serine protease n=1 Tax=Paractinoplanes aksuensis TaxID=2939490 RepID=A0ABT1DXA7_9ACTN|nr:trypsin-like serine protease [Actinoplanes aksuensis]MCO8275453.1 trypsin-like serine protease [Actinoplanes aksuensis]
MRLRWAAPILGLIVAAALAVATPAAAIRGGHDVTKAYPFAGSLQRPESPRADGHVCGVTLIAPQWALTAGHCVRNAGGAQVGTPQGWKVRIGSLSATSGGRVVAVDKFYAYGAEPVFDGDIALIHLATPVRAVPAKLPATRPAEHTPVRIAGWGMTCAERQPACYPDRLQEADTIVQPVGACELSSIVAERELCVGSPDGSVAAADLDSGGPALVRAGHRWAVAGVVSGSNGDDQPVVYTDVHHFTRWITSIVDGTDVPDDSIVPDLEGAVAFNGCSASVVRTATSALTDPALLLTNGHCVAERPAPGKAIVDQSDDSRVHVLNKQGFVQASARTTRLLYATMTGTDLAVYRLDKTYAQLGVKTFTLGTTVATAGTKLTIIAGGTGRRYSCTVDAVVPHLREADYQQDGSYRYDESCGATHGASGAPLVLGDGRTVVGVHGTGNDSGELCTENNACEVAADGTVRAEKNRRYGQRTTMLAACLTKNSRLDLTRPGCALPG